MVLTYNKKHNSSKLNAELMQLEFLKPILRENEKDGVTPIAFIKSIENEIVIRVEKELTEEQVNEINTIIANHNPIELKLSTDTEILAQSVYELAEIIELILEGGIE